MPRKRRHTRKRRQRRKRVGGTSLARIVVVAIVLAVVFLAPPLWDRISGAGDSQTQTAESDPESGNDPSGASDSSSTSPSTASLVGDDSAAGRYDPEFRPYYANLSTAEQSVYGEILEGLLAGKLDIELTADATTQQVSNAVDAICADQPDVFWIGNSQISSVGGKAVSISFESSYSAAAIATMREELVQAVAEITSTLQGKSAAEAERAAFEAVAATVEYDYEALNSSTDDGQTAYDALVGGKSVCNGYAKAFQLVMLEVGVPCYYVYGTADGGASAGDATGNGPHAWNIVDIDGSCYYVDATWGDTEFFYRSAVNYSRFNATEEAFSSDHWRDGACSFLPTCSSSPYPFESVFGESPATASFESAGFENVVAVSSAEGFRSALSERAKEASGGALELALVAEEGSFAAIEADYSNAVSDASWEGGLSGGSWGCLTMDYDEQTKLVLVSYS